VVNHAVHRADGVGSRHGMWQGGHGAAGSVGGGRIGEGYGPRWVSAQVAVEKRKLAFLFLVSILNEFYSNSNAF
jgi:hypothetical protein